MPAHSQLFSVPVNYPPQPQPQPKRQTERLTERQAEQQTKDPRFYLEPPIQPGEFELALHQLRHSHANTLLAHWSPEQVVSHYRWCQS